MKLTTFILLISLVQVSAASFAQKITLKENSISIEKVLREIRKQTGLGVFFEKTDFDKERKIQVSFKNTPLKVVLDKVLTGLQMIYSIEENIIIIAPKNKEVIKIASVMPDDNIDITGKILDENGRPLIGASIKLKDNSQSTTSDADGRFVLRNVSRDAILLISYIGYKTKEVRAEPNLREMRLEQNSSNLEEVTVNAGYYSVKQRELTGSIARVTSKDIETQPVTNVLATMAGRMAGVEIVQEGGTAGGNFQIRIRGINSLRENGNDPLYVIDGVPYSSGAISDFNTATGTPSVTSPLNSINPAYIESIEVLKDADATAIYGSRGANGVVLITTKKGKAGKTTFNVNYETAVGKVTKMLDLMNTEQYLTMRKQGFANDGITTYPANAYDVNGTWDQNRYTDWQEVLIGGTAKINNFQGSVSGGSEQTQYLLSGMYRTESTVLPGDFGHDRGAAHLSLNHSSQDKKFKLTFSGGYNFQDNVRPASDLTRISRILAPNAPALYNADGSLNFQNSTFQNPVAPLLNIVTGKVNDLVANTVLGYQIFSGLEIKANLGYTNLQNKEQRMFPSTALNPALNRGPERSSITSSLFSRQSWIVEPQLTWAHDFDFGKIEALVGTSFQQQESSNLLLSGTGFASNSLITNIAAATTKNVLNTSGIIYKYQAFFGRLNYKLDDKYIINLTARRDGSSRFGPGKQFALFGAVGATWLFSEENFLKDNSVLSFGKLRMSYGTAGNDQIGDYEFLNTYTSSGMNYQGIVGFDPSRLFNPNFAWESNKKIEAALETGFLKDRIFLTAAFYRNRSSNQLVGIPLPGTTGFPSINANLNATVQNAGFEFTLRTLNITNRNFNWASSFNVSRSRNKLVSFPGLEASTYSNRYVVGKSINIRQVYHFTGLNSQTGLYEVADVDNNGSITAANDKKTIIDLNPAYFGGLQNEFSYKNWRLNFLLQFVKQKVDDYNPFVQGGGNANQRADMVDVWNKNGDNTAFQKNSSGQNSNVINAFYNFVDSDAAIVNGSYVRLKNISLGYDLPIQVSKGVHCRIALQGQNVLTFTAYKGGDPEFRYTNYLPPLRVYSANIQLTF